MAKALVLLSLLCGISILAGRFLKGRREAAE
jgi:hypothetical protein